MIVHFSIFSLSPFPACLVQLPSLNWQTHPGLFLLCDGLIMATFGYRPATITAFINFSLSEEVRVGEQNDSCIEYCIEYSITAPQLDYVRPKNAS